MNTKHISFAFAAAAALLAGCAKSPIEEVKPSEQLTDLELSRVGAIDSKAAIDSTDFPQTGEIGLFLFKDELAETPYGESGYSNVKYAYNSSKSKWTASPSIKVGSDPGYLFGYYPYSSTATDVKEIPVESSLNGDDVMYATKQTVNDKTASQTAITMNHALARVSIKVINNGYTGKAELSKIKFSGAKIAPEGTLNALDGIITATNSDVTLDVPTADQTIIAAGTTYECLLVPSAEDSGKQTINLTLTIDGEDKTATLSDGNGVIIAQGTKSNITINLSNSGISVKTVSVKNWNVVEVGEYKVTVKVADDVPAGDIMYAPYVDGNNVIIKASSFQGKWLACNVGGSTQCEKTISNDKFTFTISNISSNIDAVLSYAPLVTLTVTSDENGKVWIGDDEDKTSGQFANGQQVEIHAAPNDKFRWFRWNDNNKENSRTIAIGESDTTYSASFISADLIPGLFTVNSSDKQVFISKGNLYCSGVIFDPYGAVNSMANAKWGFEANQYDTTPSSDDLRDKNHISHFMWCNTAEKAMALNYDYGWHGETPFFAEKNFTVNGLSGWSTLTKDEWNCLLNARTMDNGVPRYTNKVGGVTIENKGYEGLFIYPDDYSGKEVGDNTETWTWDKINSAGIVFLPAAGYRNGGSSSSQVSSVGFFGYYWSTSPNNGTQAYSLFLNNNDIDLLLSTTRSRACSVRLVTESK